MKVCFVCERWRRGGAREVSVVAMTVEEEEKEKVVTVVAWV
jgi:hypothetical protein